MPNSHRDTRLRGFTLVEISIVMIIIAIIVGGVMTGTNLLRNARVQQIIADKERYVSAIEKFRERYKAFPGDMANATDFWGARDADYETCVMGAYAVPLSKLTCDGNGNDRIDKILASEVGGSYDSFVEYFTAWQHLNNAGLIEGAFNGANACLVTNNAWDNKACYQPGKNSPATSIANGTWALFDAGSLTPLPSYYYTGVEYNHILFFGAVIGSQEWEHLPTNTLLTPREAANIDTKFDDGKPGTGFILSLKPLNNISLDGYSHNIINNCATTTNPATAKYNVQSEDIECQLLFRLPF